MELMRTLSGTLEAAQQSNSRTPYLKLTFTSLNGGTVRTFETTDTPHRILSVLASESRDGGNIITAGRQYSALIRIRDQDNDIGNLNFSGYRVEPEWGFVTGSGNESSKGPAFLVRRKRRISIPGDLLVEFYCWSLWDLLGNSHANIITGGTIAFDGTVLLRLALMDFLAGFVLDKAWQDDGGVFTEMTSESGAGDGVVRDYTVDNCLMFATTPAVGDVAYFGLGVIFNRLSIDLTTVGSGLTIVWEFFNGTIFTAVSNLSDNTLAFSSGTLKIVSFDTPSTWVQNAVNGSTQFWIRARVSAVSTPTQPKISRVLAGMHVALQLDTSTAGQGDDFQPIYTTDYRSTKRDEALKLLEYSKLGIFEQPDGFHLKFIDTASAVTVYDYDGAHDIITSIEESEDILPNKYVLTSVDPADTATPVTSSSEDTGSSDDWGVVTALVVDESISVTQDATDIADRFIDHNKRDAASGQLLVGMNVGQEVWDIIGATDPRTAVVYTGLVTRLVRTYQASLYTIDLSLGGYYSSITPEYYEEFIREMLASRREQFDQKVADEVFRIRERARTDQKLADIEAEFGQILEDVVELREIRRLRDLERVARVPIVIPRPVEPIIRSPGDPSVPTIEEVRRRAIAPPER